MRGERLHGENHGRLKSLDAIVEEIRAGGTLEAGSDCFRYGGRSSTGKEYFTHEHEAHRRGKVRANEEFVRERVAWLVLNRRQALEDGVGELLSGRERLEPTGGYRDKLRKSPGDDAANPVAQIETQDKELLERAEIPLEGAPWGQLLADGLWAGAVYGGFAAKEGMEQWRRVGSKIRHVGDYFDRDNTYSRQTAKADLTGLCRAVDGLAIDNAPHPLRGALFSALRALGTPTVRCYLQHGVPWYRYIFWRFR